jgi:hypothetical protein
LSKIGENWLGTAHEVEALVQPYTAKDPRFVQIIRKLARAFQAVEDTLFQEDTRDSFHIIRFELPGVQIVANDVLSVRYTIRLPRGQSNNIIVQYLQLQLISISAKVAATGSDFIMDCLVSKDKGTTFKSLFGPDNSTKPTLPKTLTLIKNSFFSIDQLFDEDMLRIDVIAADGVIDGVEFMLMGAMIDA